MSVYRENAAPKCEEQRATVWSIAPWASSTPRVVAVAMAMLGSSLAAVWWAMGSTLASRAVVVALCAWVVAAFVHVQRFR